MATKKYTSPLQLYKDTLAELNRGNKSVRRKHLTIAKAGRLDYLQLTGGKVSSRTLAKMGHPFGRRASGRKRGSLPALPINVQTGRLRRSIKIRRAPSKGVQSFDVGPDKSAGRSIWVMTPHGTRKMIARGIYDAVERTWKARNKALLDSLRVA